MKAALLLKHFIPKINAAESELELEVWLLNAAKQVQMIAYVHAEWSLLEAKHTACVGTSKTEFVYFDSSSACLFSSLRRLSDVNTCCVAQRMKWKYSSLIPCLQKVKMWSRFMYAPLFSLLLRTVAWTVARNHTSRQAGMERLRTELLGSN